MSTGLDTFDTSIQKTNEYFSKIEERLGWDGRREQTYLAVRSILHQLRDHLPIHESAHFAAQLPLIMKGVYFENWAPRENPLRESDEEFIVGVQKHFKYSVNDIREVISTVLDETMNLLSEGEQEKIINLLPKDVAGLFC